MNNPTLKKITDFLADNIAYIVGVPIVIYFIYFAVTTLSWRMDPDSPAFVYKAFIMNDYGQVPYRDMFVMNQAMRLSYNADRVMELTKGDVVEIGGGFGGLAYHLFRQRMAGYKKLSKFCKE